MQNERRLHRWALHLACITPLGSPIVAEIIARLPKRTALDFAMWHGDLSLLPFVGSQTNDPAISRYAGWVWQTLSGIDITASGWILSEHDYPMNDSADSSTQHDADRGLPLPNYSALQGYGISNFDKNYTQSVRMIFGHNLDRTNAVRLIKTAPQLIRSLVATLVNQRPSGVRISVRAPAVRQRVAMDKLHKLIVEAGTK
jgi:hypothetical protein